MFAESADRSATDKLRFWTMLAAFCLLYAIMAAPLMLSQTASPAMIAASLMLAAGLALLSTIDAQSFRLPDLLTLPLLVAGLAFAGLQGTDSLGWHVASAALGGGLLHAVNYAYRIFRGDDGLGRGDAKLFAASGAWVGAEGLASVLMIACGVALAAVWVWAQRNHALNAKTAIPFGPFLAAGTWAVWLYGPML